ncbi:MAG: hypothetical protein FWG96_05945 [Methanomassiliicoccaceae archaeon]|nr:hypothetical protein [Methanomassiliicoccaceae archaeon]
MDGKAILDAIIALFLYIVFAIIYFIILAFIIRFGAELVASGDWNISVDMLAVSAAILSGATIIAGGGLAEAFKKEVLK